MNETETKLAHKGVQAKQNHLRFDHFKNVLDECKQLKATNLGIRVWDRKLVTYSQVKVGLTPIYIKRKVCDDGYSTIPLEL